MTPARIVLIGAGNIASHLGPALQAAGHSIVQVVNRSQESAQRLASELNADSTTDLKSARTDVDMYLLAVSDDAIAKVAKQLNAGTALVAHTSGSIDLAAIDGVSINTGVFYPLQTFSMGRNIDWKAVPVCVEGNHAGVENKLFELGKSISDNCRVLNSEQRKQVHLAAVFVSNFTNHMYHIADELLQEKDLPFDLLQPLIAETADKIRTDAPKKMQTGPALRQDMKVLTAHANMLEQHPVYQKIYNFVTESIRSSRKK